jgi:HlyD family secretion protein
MRLASTARTLIYILSTGGVIIGAALYLQHPEPLQIDAVQVTQGPVERTVSNTRAGSVKACRRARLSTAIGGQIDQLPVREGDHVNKGALLLSLWNKDLRAEMTLSEAQVEADQSRQHAACLQAQVARREADRLKRLQHSGAASEENIDKIEIEARARQAACQAAEAAVKVAKAQVRVAAAHIERTELTAPFDGVVAQINGELNEFVTPSPPGIPTPPAIDLIDTSCFYVSAPIDEVDAASVHTGQPVRVTLDAFRDITFDAEVKRIAAFVLDLEKQARTVEIEAYFKDDSTLKSLLAGYSADVEILLETRPSVTRIPTSALVGENSVWVFNPASATVNKRQIETGISNWNFTEVSSGLESGEWLVTSTDNEALEDGVQATLRPVKP